MRAYHLESLGNFDGLRSRDEPERGIAPHEVRVRMRAASLNYRDLLIINGMVQEGAGARPDAVPLSDGAGEIIEIGAAVAGFKLGDRVAAVFNACWQDGAVRPGYLSGAIGGPVDGILAASVVLPGNGVVKLPDHLSFEEGAAHGCASVTAWSSLVGGRGLQAGQSVLVQGTGGVAIFALQYAKAMGARVIATTSSSAKAERLRALGADSVIDYVVNPEWQGEVRGLTGGEGVDRVVETGGPGTFMRSIQSTVVGGHIAVVGFSGGMEGMITPLLLIGNGITVEGIAVGSRRHFQESLEVTRLKELRPVVDKVFEFEDARGAYEHLAAHRHIGKVVIAIR